MKLVGLMLFLLAVPVAVSAGVWTVEHPGGEAPGIVQEVIDLMAEGDSLLLGPGTFQENLQIRKSMVLIGSSIDSTTIEAAADGSVILVEALAPEVSISGLTITGGTGTQFGPVTIGGGVALVTGGIGRLSIAATRIHNNEADNGGAVFVDGASALLMDRCRFEDNRAWSSSGTIHASFMDTVRLTHSIVTIEPTSGNRRPGLLGWGCGVIEVAGNLILGPEDGRQVSEVGIDLQAHTVVFHDNLVVDRGSTVVATHGALGGPGNRPEPFHVDARRNIITRDSTSHPGATITVVANGRPASFINNTLHKVPLRIATAGADTTNVSNNIFATETVTHVGGLLRYTCNDNWQGRFRSEDEGRVREEDNFSADPLFCGSEDDTLSLADDSPCLPENAPGDCGLVGARGPCGLVPVVVDGFFVIEDCEELRFGWRTAMVKPGTGWVMAQKCENGERVIASGTARRGNHEEGTSYRSCAGTEAIYVLRVGEHTVTTQSRQVCAVRRLEVRPNPATGSVEFSRRSSIQSTLRIVDAAGRLVTTLEPGQSTWSLTDDNGNSVPAGIYFAIDATSRDRTTITVVR